MVLAEKQKYRSMEENRNPRDKQTPALMVTKSMKKEARICNGEKIVSSISCAGKTGQLHVK